MSTPAAAPAPRRAWIVSPGWDLVYLVLTPVLIVPVVLLIARDWLAPEQVYLAVISFASLGHHLPGFMRAYGDRELFSRFRWRFLLAPPLIFGVALVFTPPRAVASALALPWVHLHGLELILLAWGTWHGLMQTYGFMRIYDLRRGEADRRTARLDHALCVLVFVSGVVFSDVRMFGVAGAMWQSGLPLFGPGALAAVRWLVGAASVAVLAAYALHLVGRRRRGLAINWVKLLLAAVTGWFYWYCGRLSTNLLIGIAMFEIYHAVQYNAIVWIYNRRLLQRAGERFGPLGFMFRDRLSMLGIYLAAIGAYSSIRFFTAQDGDRMFSGDLEDARQWLVALFVTSSMLHFYYDGFIWKVSDGKTGDNLLDAPRAAPALARIVPHMVHAGKWAVVAAIALALVGAEHTYRSGSAATRQDAELQMLQALSELTPRVPEARRISKQFARQRADTQYQRGLDELKQGRAETALAPLEQAAALDPTHFQAQLQLGDTLLALRRPREAIVAYQAATKLRPKSPDACVALADATLQAGDAAAAERTLREGLQRMPDARELVFTLGLLLEHRGQSAEAARLLERASQLGLSPAQPSR